MSGTVGHVFDRDIPSCGGAVEINHALACGDRTARLTGEPGQKFARDDAEIDVGAAVHLGRGDRNLRTFFGQQRRPAGDFGPVGGKRHRAKKRMCLHGGVAGAQEVHHFFAVHKTQVRNWADKITRFVDHAFGHHVRPKLLGALELREDFYGVGNIHLAGGVLVGRVAEFTDAGVAGAGVVPAVRAFLREFSRRLVNLNGQRGVEALE